MQNQTLTSLSNDILEYLILLQRNNQFINEDSDTKLSLAESAVLIEIDSIPNINLTSLATRLNLDNSTVLQIARRLISKKLIQKSISKNKRHSSFVLTKVGEKTLKHYDILSNLRLEQFIIGITNENQKLLEKLLTALSDSGCQLPGVLRTDDHPLRLQMRRLTISFGLLNRKFRSSTLTVAEWQILTELNKNPTNATTLIKKLSLSQNYLSQIIKKLESQKLVKAGNIDNDKRIQILSITAEGKLILNKINSNIITQIKTAVKPFLKDRLKEAVKILAKFVGANTHLEFSIPKTEFTLHSADDSQTLNDCRVFYAKEQLKLDSPLLPECLYTASQPVYLLKKGKQIIASISLKNVKDEYTIECYAERTNLPKAIKQNVFKVVTAHAKRFLA